MDQLINNPQICITGIGMVTSVGHDVRTACASIRANLKRPTKLDRLYIASKQGHDDPEDGLITGHPAFEGDHQATEARLFTLITKALEDLYNFANMEQTENPPVYISMPEEYREKVDKENLKAHFPDKEFIFFNQGHAGMIIALSQATEAISSGKYERAIVAGMDSLIGLDDLVLFDKAKRLKTELNPEGLTPGEAASAILIEKISTAENRNASIKAVIDKISTGFEKENILSGHDATGNGLVNIISKLIEDKENKISPDIILSDINGEVYRTEELGNIHFKIMNQISGEKKIIYPSKNLGDTGAAYAGIAVCMSVRAMARGYISETKEEGNALVLASSDSGVRGSVYIIPYKKEQ